MPINTSGTLSLLRVHDRGTAYGPPADRIDVEVVAQFEGRPSDAYGFQLRNDANLPARRGMFDLLRDGFSFGHKVHIDYDIADGAHNGVVMRVWLTRQRRAPVNPLDSGAALDHPIVEG